jgi:hypothetical protein
MRGAGHVACMETGRNVFTKKGTTRKTWTSMGRLGFIKFLEIPE